MAIQSRVPSAPAATSATTAEIRFIDVGQRADAELAGSHADDLAVVWRSIEAGDLYPQQQRVFGPKLLNRLAADWSRVDRLRAQDLEWAEAIDAVVEWDLECARGEESGS